MPGETGNSRNILVTSTHRQGRLQLLMVKALIEENKQTLRVCKMCSLGGGASERDNRVGSCLVLLWGSSQSDSVADQSRGRQKSSVYKTKDLFEIHQEIIPESYNLGTALAGRLFLRWFMTTCYPDNNCTLFRSRDASLIFYSRLPWPPMNKVTSGTAELCLDMRRAPL